MVIRQVEEPKIHWNYFLALESDCQKLARYIEFTENNFSAYSIELSHLLLASASEVDVVAKLLCKKIDESKKTHDIKQCRELIKPVFTEIQNMKVTIPRNGLDFSPWRRWNENENPSWWRAYNNVKHKRNIHFAEANLQHVLNALGGLFILLLYLYKEDAYRGNLFPSPSLFKIEEKYLDENRRPAWGDSSGRLYYNL